MFLVLDIGNSSVTWGLVENGRLGEHGRWTAMSDVGVGLARLPRVDGVAALTVAPERARPILAGVQRAMRCEPLVAGRDLPVPIENLTRVPQRVGVDRLLAALAAYARTGGATIVVDAGSAITIDYVDGQGRFHGGAILPGAGLSARALHQFTERLPEVEVRKPENLIGRDTEEAMQSGIYWGTVGAVRGILDAIRRNGIEAQVMFTGGDGAWIAEEIGRPDQYDASLTLEGLWVAYDKGRRG